MNKQENFWKYRIFIYEKARNFMEVLPFHIFLGTTSHGLSANSYMIMLIF